MPDVFDLYGPGFDRWWRIAVGVVALAIFGAGVFVGWWFF